VSISLSWHSSIRWSFHTAWHDLTKLSSAHSAALPATQKQMLQLSAKS